MEMQLLRRKIFFLPNFSLAGMLRSTPATIATGVTDTNQDPSSGLRLTGRLAKRNTIFYEYWKILKKVNIVLALCVGGLFASLVTKADVEEFV